MAITADTLRRAGFAPEQIARALEAEASEYRDKARLRARRYRARHANHVTSRKSRDAEKAEQNQQPRHANHVTQDSSISKDSRGISESPSTPIERPFFGTARAREEVSDAPSVEISDFPADTRPPSHGGPIIHGAPIAETWRPNSDGLLQADRAGLFGAALETEIERFRNYYLASGARLVRWDKKWANWLISPYRSKDQAHGVRPNGQQPTELVARSVADLRVIQRERMHTALAKLADFAGRGGGAGGSTIGGLSGAAGT